MFPADQQAHDDQGLIPYLLGLLPDEETVRLDELSITDGEFAWRLKAAENDLVDSYVSGGLSGETLDRFRSVYLSSAAHREKVGFAESLLLAGQPIKRVAAVTEGSVGPANSRFWRWLFFPPRAPTWAIAACAFTLLAGAGYLVREERALRRQLTQTETERSNLAQEVGSLQSRVEAPQPAPNRQTTPSETPAQNLEIASFVLLAQARGAGPLPVITLSPETNRVELQLELESDDFPAYQVTLQDLAANRVIRRDDALKAHHTGKNRFVSLALQSNLLKQQNYIMVLNGIPAGGAPEFVAGYPFRVGRTSKP